MVRFFVGGGFCFVWLVCFFIGIGFGFVNFEKSLLRDFFFRYKDILSPVQKLVVVFLILR